MKTLLMSQVGLIAVALASGLAMADDTKPKTPLIQQVFDQQRSVREDVIYFRNKDVLRGEVLNESLTIATQYGLLQVPLRRCAGLSFEGARANTEALVTVNYNRITGIITDNVINFKIASSGTTIPIRKEKVRFVLLRQSPKELEFIEDAPKADLFLMANGDLLSGEAKEREIAICTDYATVPVSFKEMKDVTMQGGDNVTAVVSKTNGDTMRGTLDTDEITLDLEIGVEVAAVYKDKFARVFVDRAPGAIAGATAVSAVSYSSTVSPCSSATTLPATQSVNPQNPAAGCHCGCHCCVSSVLFFKLCPPAPPPGATAVSAVSYSSTVPPCSSATAPPATQSVNPQDPAAHPPPDPNPATPAQQTETRAETG